MVILGSTASGKSSLALKLMAWGAGLVADDQTILTPKNDVLFASAPEAIVGLIEARNVGLLEASYVENTRILFAVDLDKLEQKRLPEKHEIELAGIAIPCVHKVDSSHFPASILQYLKGGRRQP
ncbi:HPr kinase/phosphorylase [Roseobacter sp.]|uniref:HPr kinase/phosphorylase n=1 Tax=Roseobacter sp. TaxID=1907202 RepID=UPI00385E6F59